MAYTAETEFTMIERDTKHKFTLPVVIEFDVDTEGGRYADDPPTRSARITGWSVKVGDEWGPAGDPLEAVLERAHVYDEAWLLGIADEASHD